MNPSLRTLLTWALCTLSTAGVITRPGRWPEAVWAVAGALILVAGGLLPLPDALRAVAAGTDVYLFLLGMMLLSETARRAGLFEWAAAAAVNRARGSSARLFVLVFAVGAVVTVFLSNDATAIVLTPAVYAAARKARATPRPHLFACAMVANAASFVLPISNPANLVLYGGRLPPLGAWFAAFALPSALSIGVTALALRYAERASLREPCAPSVEQPPLSASGRAALAGILVTAAALLVVSALDRPLGTPTCLAGIITSALVLARTRSSPRPLLASVSWSVFPLVAGLFVLVGALDRTGVIDALVRVLLGAVRHSARVAAALAGSLVALSGNLTNNLPAGLIASSTLARAHPPRVVTDAVLIGVDLGPNLSITGSLATILWLSAIRREGEDIGFWSFLRVGAVVMPPALALALAARVLLG